LAFSVFPFVSEDCSLFNLLSIQYVYERVILFSIPQSVFQEAGAKVEILFDSRKLFSKFFLENFHPLFLPICLPSLPMNFRLLRGAKLMLFFIPRKLFGEKIFNPLFPQNLLSIPKELRRYCGCKSRQLFFLCKIFGNIFLRLFSFFT